MRCKMTLSGYIHDLQSRAVYIFTQEELPKVLEGGHEAIRKAIARLLASKQIVRLHTGLFCIVPVEYQNVGAPPGVWIIDALMSYLRQPYYVGLLTASALHGAAHQQPFEFQVITTKQVKPLSLGRSCIKFYTKHLCADTPAEMKKSDTGYFKVSTPEVTAFDLLKYINNVGSLQNVATVLQELAAKIDPKKLVAAASYFDLPTIQRTGYLLETYGEVAMTDKLLEWVTSKKPRVIALRSDLKPLGIKNTNWRIIVNDEIEVDI